MKLKQQHFYYGAILSALIEYNPDASMVMLQKDVDDRRVYQIETNTNQGCYIFFKHAFEKKNVDSSWLFTFTQPDILQLKNYHTQKIPTFLYLLCANTNLKNSEIAILKLDEFLKLNKTSITIKIPKNSHTFHIARGNSPVNDYEFPRNRIEKSFDDLINEVIKESKGYYSSKCRWCKRYLLSQRS